MSFEYTIEKNNKKTLSKDQEAQIVQCVTSRFLDWDDIRTQQIHIYETLKPEIYLEERRKKDTWKSQKRLNKIYSLFSTRQAFLWENLYADPKKMFDVSGKNARSEETAKAQKEAIADALDKMKVSQQLDKAVEFLDTTGEFCIFTAWNKKYKQIRRPLTFAESLAQGRIVSLIKGETVTGIFEELIYDGAYVEAVNPINLVFDPSIHPEIEHEWDSGGKIIKSWKTYDQIAENKIYQLSKEQLSDIKAMLCDAPADDKKEDADIIEDTVHENKIEVLEYWGNFVFDGMVFKNYAVAVIGRKYLARFIENPFIINPIINVATLRHPDSKRGIPCLWSVYDTAKAQEDDVNEAKDVQQLNKNTVIFAPKGFFKDEKNEMFPGKIIEYDPAGEDPNALKPLQFQLYQANDQIQFLDKVISDTSGIFPNMQGQDESKNVTATEIKVKVSGQTTRLSKDIDTVKQNGIIKMVQNIADLQANEKNGQVQELFFRENGKLSNVLIDDAVRQGQYEYKYTDGSALAVKKSQFAEALKLFQTAAGMPSLNQSINWKEVLVQGLETIGIDYTDRFFVDSGQNAVQNPSAQNGVAAANGQLINAATANGQSARMGIPNGQAATPNGQSASAVPNGQAALAMQNNRTTQAAAGQMPFLNGLLPTGGGQSSLPQ